jgi:hypothetical protein
MRDTEAANGWHRSRATLLGALATLLTLAAAAATWQGLVTELHDLSRRSAVRTLDALPVLLWAALLLTLLWAALLIVLATVSIARFGGGRSRDNNRSPGPRPGALITRTAGLLLAMTTLSSIATTAPASAATATDSARLSASVHPAKTVDPAADSCASELPVPGWVPGQPARTDQVARECAPLVTGNPVADDSGEVVVHRGDTLWSIAAAHLGPYGDARSIAAEWPRWYAANRDLIGDDPDLLTVGARLRPPDPAVAGSAR